MKKIILTCFLLLSFFTFSQTEFEKGYLIFNNGEKIECLIRNLDWLDIPSRITYKINEEINTISAENLNKIEIYDKAIFERFDVELEMYSNKLKELSKDRKSTFKEHNLLLKLLISSDEVSLYKYNEDNVDYFFYKKNDKILVLEYKPFITSSNKILQNLNYQKTIKDEFSCGSNLNFKNIKYKEKDLVNFFKKYLNCKQLSYRNYSSLDRKIDLNLRGKISLGQSSATNPFNSSSEYDFEKKIIYKIGLELEYILPFNKNKWGIFIEPTFSSYNADVPNLNPSSRMNIDYKTIEIPLGLRHYLYLNKKNKLFINTGINIVEFLISGTITHSQNQELELKPYNNLFFGLGYDFNSKYLVELRLNTQKNLNKTNPIPINYNNFSIKLGYNFM